MSLMSLREFMKLSDGNFDISVYAYNQPVYFHGENDPYYDCPIIGIHIISETELGVDIETEEH